MGSPLSVDDSYLLKGLCKFMAGNKHTLTHGDIAFQTGIAKVSRGSLFPIFVISFAISFWYTSGAQLNIGEATIYSLNLPNIWKKLHGLDEPLPKTVAWFESIRRAWATAIPSCVYA
jgi:hypothetical protein